MFIKHSDAEIITVFKTPEELEAEKKKASPSEEEIKKENSQESEPKQ